MEQSKIIEVKDLPVVETVYLKKDRFGYRVVEPWKDPQTGKINWFNFLLGGKRGLLFMVIVSIIATALYFGVLQLIGNYQTIADNPCQYCTTCLGTIKSNLPVIPIR